MRIEVLEGVGFFVSELSHFFFYLIEAFYIE